MARDKYSGEAAQLFRQYGWYRKFQDAGWANKSAKLMQAQEEPGAPDSLLLPFLGGRAFIEHKTGDGTHRERFTFDKWTERQRLYCVALEWSGFPYWLFLVMGATITHRDYPRVAYLLRGETMFDLIRLAGERKSLSYETARTRLSRERLAWGKGRWHLPSGHPFEAVVRGEINEPTYRPWPEQFRRHLQTLGGEVPAPQDPQGKSVVEHPVLQPDLMLG